MTIINRKLDAALYWITGGTVVTGACLFLIYITAVLVQ